MYDTKPINITVKVKQLINHMEVQKEAVNGGKRSVKPAGPWVVRRPTKDGRVVIRYRHPSSQERQNNRLRERNRRSVTHKIFYGLRKFGNYNLSKKADTIDILKAVCEEAGWHVEEDGTVYKKKVAHEVGGGYKHMENSTEPTIVLPEVAQEDHNIDLRLSLSLASN